MKTLLTLVSLRSFRSQLRLSFKPRAGYSGRFHRDQFRWCMRRWDK